MDENNKKPWDTGRIVSDLNGDAKDQKDSHVDQLGRVPGVEIVSLHGSKSERGRGGPNGLVYPWVRVYGGVVWAAGSPGDSIMGIWTDRAEARGWLSQVRLTEQLQSFKLRVEADAPSPDPISFWLFKTE